MGATSVFGRDPKAGARVLVEESTAVAGASVRVSAVLVAICVEFAVPGETDVDPQAVTTSMVTMQNDTRNLRIIELIQPTLKLRRFIQRYQLPTIGYNKSRVVACEQTVIFLTSHMHRQNISCLEPGRKEAKDRP